MDLSLPSLTPEMRQALDASGGLPIRVADPLTQRVYLLVEQPASPQLDEEYIRQGLQVDLEESANGQFEEALSLNSIRILAVRGG